MNRYVIVGGVAAGATAAARIRRLEEDAEVVLIERGPYVSYANCGLPYYAGGEIASRNALFVATKESIEAKYKVRVLENTEVTRIDREKKEVLLRTKDGEESSLSYTKLLLSTGSSPIVPPFPGVDSSRVFTLWTVPDVDRIKAFIEEKKVKRAVVVGGGFIGLEMAENLHSLGIEIDLVEKLPQVMAPLDPDMSKLLENHLADQGIRLHLGLGLTEILEDGRKVRLEDQSEIETDMVLLSIGVRPNSSLAKEAGLRLNERGYVVTDDRLQTSDPDIYAAGDVIEVTDFVSGIRGSVPLAGPANKQGRIAAGQMTGKEDRVYKGTQGTSVVRVFDLTAAITGQSEKALKRRGLQYGEDYLYSLIHPQSHASYFPGALPMCIKLLFSKKDAKVLGAEIVGYDGVDKRIDVIATALRFGASIYDLTELELAYAPPFGSAKDPVNLAAYAATNQYEGITDPCRVEDLPNLDEKTVLLDIQENPERAVSQIGDAKHIPLTELRERLGELDPSLCYVTYCAVGLRGYLAERILKQSGFRAKDLLGGIRTYKELTREITLPEKKDAPAVKSEERKEEKMTKTVTVNACGLSCPGPIVEVAKSMKNLGDGERIRVLATDPGFTRDIESWCENTGNRLIEKGKEGVNFFAVLEKGQIACTERDKAPDLCTKEKTMIVFSGDLDKAIASFIIANGAAAMGNKVNMFFTFWGLNILRKVQKVRVKKDFMSRMFAGMMPRGSKKLPLSKMNFGGAGAKMIRSVMKKKNIDSLENLMRQAMDAGVKITACQMSMDVMGITKEELIEGVEIGGVASMLNDNDHSNMNLFI